MLFSELEKITGGRILRLENDNEVSKFRIDSRKATKLKSDVFIAVKGARNDGHDFIPELELENYIIEDPKRSPDHGNVILVESGIDCLQAIARHHRSNFRYPVLAITGSNAKTTIKEWLFEIVAQEFKVLKSPKSYNSQVGVPISVLEMDNHDVAIFEAGISEVGEMAKLAKIIQPTIGLFTNIGEAHSKGFKSQLQKIREKSLLFEGCEKIICCADHDKVLNVLSEKYPYQLVTWSLDKKPANYDVAVQEGKLRISNLDFPLPFQNKEQTENLIHCIVSALEMGVSAKGIMARMEQLKAIPRRLELKKGVNNCYLVDDSYNNDLLGLEVALDFTNQQNPDQKKVLILSDLVQSYLGNDQLAIKISELVKQKRVDRYYQIGSLQTNADQTFPTTKDFIDNLPEFSEETILIKGARTFQFEQIVDLLEEKTHGTYLEVNFEALRRNLNRYRMRLKSSTKMMVMTKAFAYGSGLSEISSFLQHEQVDYLGVAYLDEAISLRRRGITLPIMIMNPGEVDFSYFDEFQVEAEIYSPNILKKYIASHSKSGIHLKLETGMNRLGIREEELNEILDLLLAQPTLKVLSILTHFSSSDLTKEDDYTRKQADKFNSMYERVVDAIGYEPIKHAVNSAGLVRFPEYHFDMVRLGIGLHGFDPSGQIDSEFTSSLKSHISQIRSIKAGESIGYSRRGKAEKDIQIAVIPIGYSDGYRRAFGNGKAHIMINGHRAPTIGNICMDMCMVDVSNLSVKEGDEVVIFGDSPNISDLAEWADTIPYEILTDISERVKRVYVSE